MKNFDVQAIAIACSAERVFDYVAQPSNLPRWTHAFSTADDAQAEMVTPEGSMTISLATLANREARTVDWRMTMPDGSVGMAYSRVTPITPTESIYSFVLMAPPVPLEMLEGALSAQIAILAEELKKLNDLPADAGRIMARG